MWLNLYGFLSIIPIWPSNKVTIEGLCMINHMSLINPQRLLSQHFHNFLLNFAFKMVTSLLGHIWMLIPWLKNSWITKSETPNSRLTISNSAFGFWIGHISSPIRSTISVQVVKDFYYTPPTIRSGISWA